MPQLQAYQAPGAAAIDELQHALLQRELMKRQSMLDSLRQDESTRANGELQLRQQAAQRQAQQDALKQAAEAKAQQATTDNTTIGDAVPQMGDVLQGGLLAAFQRQHPEAVASKPGLTSTSTIGGSMPVGDTSAPDVSQSSTSTSDALPIFRGTALQQGTAEKDAKVQQALAAPSRAAAADALLTAGVNPEHITGYLDAKFGKEQAARGPKSLQHVEGAVNGQHVSGSYNPEDGSITVNGQDVTAQFKPYDKPTGDNLHMVKTVDDQGNAVTRFMSNEDIRNSGGSFKAPPSGATQTRVDAAKAVYSTGQDIKAQLSDPAVAKALGPVLGRYTNLQDFIGNPPPEYAKLAGEIESFALANMGVHGMRSAQGAEAIKKMLSGQHTPASLAATIDGLTGFTQHYVEGSGQKMPESKPAPSGSRYKVTVE
jgi:hypothetical protein